MTEQNVEKERPSRACPDGVLRHTLAVALDCPRCHPECHTGCCGAVSTTPEK